jgi:hypothetical protein
MCAKDLPRRRENDKPCGAAGAMPPHNYDYEDGVEFEAHAASAAAEVSSDPAFGSLSYDEAFGATQTWHRIRRRIVDGDDENQRATNARDFKEPLFRSATAHLRAWKSQTA